MIQVIAAGFAGNVDVLAQLDVTVGSQDEEPPVAPDAQAVGRKPIHANIAGSAVAVHHHVAEILKFGVRGMIHIRDLRPCHLSGGRAGVIDELVRLVGTDIAENATVLGRIPKPVGASNVIHLVGSDIHRLHYFADGAGLDQVTSLHRGAHFQPLGVHNGEHLARLRRHLAHLGQLV